MSENREQTVRAVYVSEDWVACRGGAGGDVHVTAMKYNMPARRA